MKLKFFVIIASLALLVSSNQVTATLITVDQWHDTTDLSQGLRESSFDSTVFFAVSKQNQFNFSDEYEVLDGFHLASFEEYDTLYKTYLSAGNLATNNLVHHNQDGWRGYNWDGKNKYYFVLEDQLNSTTVNKVLHAGCWENTITCQTARNTETLARNFTQYGHLFAGFVLIKDPVSVSVPEPSTLFIFTLSILALTSRRFSKKD
jgi:hypothetical protein